MGRSAEVEDQGPGGLRVVLLGRVPAAVQALDGFLRGLGHRPVALVTATAGAARYGDVGSLDEIVSGLPAGVDTLVASGPDRLAPLIGAHAPDVAVSATFPMRVPPDALAVPRLGIVNVHPSLLPRHRGPNPIGWTLRNGEPVLGMTLHRMVDEIDAGPLLAQGSLPIDEHDDEDEIFGKMAALIAQLLPISLERVARGDAGDPQDATDATDAGFFEDAYAYVDWRSSARPIHDQVRAWRFAAIAGVRGPIADLDGRRVRLVKTRLDGRAGGIRVECGDGPLWVLESEALSAG
jgi:methionyl-tRNA formyltransferase